MKFGKTKKLFIFSFLLCQTWLHSEQLLVSCFTESEYESVERVFTNNTGHIENLTQFISSKFLSGDLKTQSFLEIGPGPGTIACNLSKFFQTTTVIEPNKVFAPIFKEKGFITHIGNFQDVQIEDKYDVILCSHVLYHVPYKQWTPFIEKIHESIQPGGVGVINMVATKGPFHEMRASIIPNYSNSKRVEKSLQELQIPYELFPVPSVFKVSNYEDFRALVRLFTLDDCYLPETYQALSDQEKEEVEQKIENYIKTCKQPDGSYMFIDEDMYIVIHRG